MLPARTSRQAGAGEKSPGVSRWTKKVSPRIMREKGKKKGGKMKRREGDVKMNEKLVRELVEEVRGEVERGEVGTIGEALAKRGVSRKLFREMGGIEAWKSVGRGRREEEVEEREEGEEMGKEELGKFLSRVIRGRELGMGGKEKMSAVGLYMRLKGWDKVKEEREELVGEEMRELLKKDKEKG